MHYRNGREAKNGDKLISLADVPYGTSIPIGTLRDATPGNDYCNGYVQQYNEPRSTDPIACMCDCLHMDDFVAILAEKGLDKRPAGK